MRRVFLLLLAGSILLAQDFKPYTGSKLDEKATREASATAAGKVSEVYTTSDPFDEVYAFYKTLYKELRSSGCPCSLPSSPLDSNQNGRSSSSMAGRLWRIPSTG